MHIYDTRYATGWEPIERPGYLGKNRDKKFKRWTEEYGTGWCFGWKVNHWLVPYEQACRLYEDAYHAFLVENPDTVDLLTRTASNVYDDAISNVASGFDYNLQETDRTHIQDIAIRNALLRLGRWFEGSELIQIRDAIGDHSLSLTLSPGRVPFHRPEWITDELPPRWWQSGSVESFYQSNRWLMVRR